jgi:D-sedoheptulose 7-phosphate isomerase
MLKSNEKIISFLKNDVFCTEQIIEKHLDIKKITNILMKARDSGKIIYTMGNGGSGSTASHFTSDLLKTTITKEKKRFKSISLIDNTPVLLSWSNDVSYDEIFKQQLQNFVNSGDILVAFSGSGNSLNVIKALKFASKAGVVCIGFTGKSGGKMKKLCDFCFTIPSTDMLLIESQHVLICHCMISYIRNQGTPKFKYE